MVRWGYLLQNDVAKRDFLKRTLKHKNVTFCKVVLMGNGAKKWVFWAIFHEVANYLCFSGLGISILTFLCYEIEFS